MITQEDSEALAIYLKEIGKNTKLSANEEKDIAVKIHKGDKNALDQLILANTRFVVSVARNYQNQGVPLTDLINEGNLGLIKAAKRFDEKKNFKFISYAVWWIRQAILQYISENSRHAKLPLNRSNAMHKMGKMYGKLEQKFKRTPGLYEVAKELGISVEVYEETLKMGLNTLSFENPVFVDNKEYTLGELIKVKGDNPSTGAYKFAMKKDIDKVLNCLTEREKKVIEMYFGLGEETVHTLEEIGKRYSLTRERARQIKEKAINRLKKGWNINKLLAYKN